MSTKKLFASQSQLPRLPVPDLRSTCKLFLNAARVIETPAQFERTQQLVEEFLKEGGDGQRLQALLMQLNAEPSISCHLDAFWESMYLRIRDPLPINVNPCFVLEDDPTPSRHSQIARATSLILASLKFCVSVRQETLEPDMFRTTPLCMRQYSRLFGACRTPKHGCDEGRFFPDSRHIVVISRSQFYWFEVLDENNSLLLDTDGVGNALASILEDSKLQSDADVALNAVGVLTAGARDGWAACRERLCALSPSNAQGISVIDSALFIVCLDHTSPETADGIASNCLHGCSVVEEHVQRGTCINRWFDKSLQIIVCRNGMAGINFEHSFIDGHTVLRFASDVFTETILRFAELIRGGFIARTSGARDVEAVQAVTHKIAFRLNQELRVAIKCSEAAFSDFIAATETNVLEYSGYGKRYIMTKNFSPDAFMQVAFQCAYSRVYGEIVNTYETVMTKKFLHARTEAGRCTTAAVSKFCKVFNSDAGASAKAEALHEACVSHTEMIKLASAGAWYDRHLYALKCVAEQRGEALPNLFLDDGWQLLHHDVMSTSNCGNPALRLFGFGPVVADGFGLGYIIKDEGMQICCTSFRRQTRRFVLMLHSVFDELKRVIEADPHSSCQLYWSGSSGARGARSDSSVSSPAGMVASSAFSPATVSDAVAQLNLVRDIISRPSLQSP